MSAGKGWRASVVLSSDIVDEEMQGSPAAAGQTAFYSRSFPIVDPATRAVTDDETKVTLKDNGTPVAAGNFTLTGADGKVVFSVAPGQGHVITLSYSYEYTLAYGRSSDVTIDGGLDEVYVLSQRTPKEILEGEVRISGRLEEFFTGRDFLGKLVPDPDGNVGQPEFTIYLYPLGNAQGKPKFTVGGVKFSPWKLAIPDPDSPITESLDWRGKTVTPSVVP